MIMQSKVYVCGGSITRIVGPNPAGGKNVPLSCFLCAAKVMDYATRCNSLTVVVPVVLI